MRAAGGQSNFPSFTWALMMNRQSQACAETATAEAPQMTRDKFSQESFSPELYVGSLRRIFGFRAEPSTLGSIVNDLLK
jgi:hypothetical protein